MFRHRAMNANISETSSITLAVGFPAPWPALVSTWMSKGLLCFRLRPTMYWSVAMNLRECSGTTRSSWSAVRRSMEGYWMPSASGSFTLCRGEYLQSRGASVRMVQRAEWLQRTRGQCCTRTLQLYQPNLWNRTWGPQRPMLPSFRPWLARVAGNWGAGSLTLQLHKKGSHAAAEIMGQFWV